MTCSCPKCDAIIDIDLERVPSAGHYIPCPSCKSRFWAQKESFINRAFKKEGKIYCLQCDAELGLLHICGHCSTLLPDYCLVQKSKPPQRKKDSSLSLNLVFSSGSGSRSAISSVRSGSVSSNKSLFVKLTVVTLIAVVSVSGFLFFKNMKKESTYVANYVRALHGVKSGVDKSLSVFVNMNVNTGYGLSSQEIDVIKSGKQEIDKRMSLLEDAPKKFLDQKNKIDELFSVYNQLYNLTISPTISANADKVIVLEEDFNKKALALRSSLSPELSVELKNASARYRNMGIFVD